MVPFFEGWVAAFWPPAYVVFVALVVCGTSNAVNLSDGLDGLAAGLGATALATFAVFAYLIGRIDTSAYLGLLYLPVRRARDLRRGAGGRRRRIPLFNSHPAQVFMGDTGALAIGGALAVLAILLKAEFLLLLVGAVFVAEALSVILQVGWFKYTRRRSGTGRRILLMAPLQSPLREGGVGRVAGGRAVLDPRGPLGTRRAQHPEGPVTSSAARSVRTPVGHAPPGVAVLGLGASGDAAARLALEKYGSVYVSDHSDDGGTRRRARALEALGADVQLGGHDLGRIAGAGVVVASPGIPGNAPVLLRLRARGVRWISEPEFAARFRTGALIGVTGTNGKTTTSVLIGHLLGAAGIDAAVGGNVGGGIAPPASALALRSPRAEWWVLELSSFQLAGIERFSPEIGVLTNLSEDHLDRYGEVARYFADKKRLFRNATAASRWVVNGEDAEALALAGDATGELHLFAGRPRDAEPLPARGRLSAFVRDGVLTLGAGASRGPDASDEPLVPRDRLRLLGRHNVMNALAAALAARLAGAPPAGLRRGLASFAPLRTASSPSPSGAGSSG